MPARHRRFYGRRGRPPDGGGRPARGDAEQVGDRAARLGRTGPDCPQLPAQIDVDGHDDQRPGVDHRATARADNTARPAPLATATRTVALLAGLLDRPDRWQPMLPQCVIERDPGAGAGFPGDQRPIGQVGDRQRFGAAGQRMTGRGDQHQLVLGRRPDG